MGVVKSKRNESKMQFLQTAQDLEIFTIEQCKKIPKSYTFLLTTRICDCSCEIYGCIKKANSIFPTNEHEAQIRRDYFVKARAELQNLSSQVDIAYRMVPITEASITKWYELISQEILLISKILKSDKERFKNI